MKRWFAPLACLILAAGCAGIAWFAWREHVELIQWRATAIERANALDVLRRGEKADHDRLLAFEKQREATLKRREARRNAGGAADAPRAKRSGPVDLTPYMEKDPEYARLHHLRVLQQVERMYGDLKYLNLPADQLAKLRELLAERIEAPQDAREAAEAQGIDPNSREYGKAIGAAMTDVNSDIKALVGDAAYGVLTQKQMASGFESQLEYQIAPDLTAAGVSLSADQIQALAQAQAQAVQSAMGTLHSAADYQQAQFQALLQAGSKILSPDQFSVFQQSVGLQQQYQAMQSRAVQAAQAELGHVNSWTIRGY